VIKSELLTEVTRDQATRLINSDRFGGEEKHNGERRTIVKDASGIRDFNREGNKGKGLPSHIINMLVAHPLPSFTIDCEWEKGIVVVLDVLVLGGLNFAPQPYAKRKEAAHLAFDNQSNYIRVTKTVTGRVAKLALIAAMEADHAEGVVFKDLTAPWRPGRSEQHFKLKFWKSLDCIVIAPSPKGHNSVEVGVFNRKGKMHRICGVSLNGKPSVKMGDVLEIDYLYGTDKLEVVQPNLARVRDDKRPSECTTAQIIVNANFLGKVDKNLW
jgi:ATP-dependent DNA ligase